MDLFSIAAACRDSDSNPLKTKDKFLGTIDGKVLTQTDPQKSEKIDLLDHQNLLDFIRHTLHEHKAENAIVMDLRKKSTIGDYMVIASGNSTRQIVTLAENLVQKLKLKGLMCVKPEGLQQGSWVLIDAGDVIIHLFRPETRDFYNLEKMWEANLEVSKH